MSVAVVSDSLWPHELSSLLCPWDFPGKNTVVGCHFLLQEIFPTQGSNLGLPHCRQILYHLSQIRKKYQIPQPHHYRLYQKTLNQKNENHALSHKPSNHWKWVWVGTSLVVQWLGLWASNAGGTVQSLVGELRSCMLCSVAINKKEEVDVDYWCAQDPGSAGSIIFWEES